jgi:hypothetical protein
MKKSLAFALLSVLVLSASSGAMAANTSGNPVVTGAKKVGLAIAWPFKKVGAGLKAVGHKVSGK